MSRKRTLKDPHEDAELLKAVASWKQAKIDQESLKKEDIIDMKKRFKKVVDKTKRDTQLMNDQQNRPKGKTRSSKNRITERAIRSNGIRINKGIDDASEIFQQHEKEFLEKDISKVRQVCKLKLEHLKYLVIDVFLDELKQIQSGVVKSDFHDRYMRKDGESKTELRQEIRTSLFDTDQRDYISGLLQGAFQNTSQDNNGDIKHSAINYVEIVMMYETVARIVRYVHKFDTMQETLDYMRKKSREASGIDDDD